MEPQRHTRKTLKSIFQKGELPTEASFSGLIDSTINIIDDGINKSVLNGYELAPQGKSKNLLSFFKSLEKGNTPKWQFSIRGKENEEGLAFGIPEDPKTNTPEKNILFFDVEGNIGVRNLHPVMPLSVKGIVGMEGRIGMYSVGKVDGNGKYQTILEGITEPDAFEIVAKINGAPKRGKYAMTHAIATCTHPIYLNSWFNKIHQTNAFYGWPWNRIKLKWKKKDGNLNLQIKTRSNYGINPETKAPFQIRYHISKLWDDKYVDGLIENNERTKFLTKKPEKLNI